MAVRVTAGNLYLFHTFRYTLFVFYAASIVRVVIATKRFWQWQILLNYFIGC